jgi:hypothetical protein
MILDLLLQISPSIPFEGYKLSHIEALEEERIQILRAKILSLHPFILESLNSLFIPPRSSFFVMENLIISFI